MVGAPCCAAILLQSLLLFQRGVTAQESIPQGPADEEDTSTFEIDDFEDLHAPNEEGELEKSVTPDQLRNMHKKFDTDGDSLVSLSEILKFAKEVKKEIAVKNFENMSIIGDMDSSKDGMLSMEEHMIDVSKTDSGDENQREIEVRRRETEAAKFKAADVNGNGLLDSQEIPALFYPETRDEVLAITVAETMHHKDTDQNGKLTPEEFWESETWMKMDLDSDHSDYGMDLESEHSDDAPGITDKQKADFDKLDLNEDGQLDMSELQHWESGRFHTELAMKQLITLADTNNDLHLSVQELVDASERISGVDAAYHLVEWTEHHEL